ncbi:MAG: MipA/OmpV family protein [Paracoccaceae bacterium]
MFSFSFIKNLKTSFILFFLMISSINAESKKENYTLNESRNFDLNIGLGIINTPKYEGSDNSLSRTVPFLDFKYKKIKVNPIAGVKVDFFNNESWSFNYGVGLNLGRDPKQDNNLSGLNKINWTLEPKVGAKYKSKYYSISSELAYDIFQKGHKGSYLKTSLGSGFPIIGLNTFIIPPQFHSLMLIKHT